VWYPSVDKLHFVNRQCHSSRDSQPFQANKQPLEALNVVSILLSAQVAVMAKLSPQEMVRPLWTKTCMFET
jgi:hypothetical protein